MTAAHGSNCTAEQRLLGSEVANVWSGAYIAMFSECAQVNGPAADFKDFRYTAQP